MERIFLLKLGNGSTLEARAPIDLELQPHDMCIFARDFYTDIAEVSREIDPTKLTSPVGGLPQISKVADNAELNTMHANAEREKTALATCQTQIERLGLDMKLVNAHSSLDGKLMTIQFSADGRVDFRELVKELSRSLATRIELRQIGVRDETGIYGGIGVCGQPLCCCRFLKEFNSINVKMAKDQDLSLTPATISGVCGRLKCCLKFEHATYLELGKGMPRKGDMCETVQGTGKIVDRNLLTQSVSVAFESGSIAHFPVTEIKLLTPERRNNNGNRKNFHDKCPGCRNCPAQHNHRDKSAERPQTSPETEKSNHDL